MYLKTVLCSLLAVIAHVAAPAARAADECSINPEIRISEMNGEAADNKVKIKADEIDFPARNMVLLRGYTQLVRGGHRVFADELVYDKIKNEVEARGVVKYENPKGDSVQTSVLKYDVATGVAVSGPAVFVIANRKSDLLGSGHSTVNAHGAAEEVTFESDEVMLLKNAEVTSCLDGEKDITFNADELTVNLNEGVRTGKRVKVKIAEPNKHRRIREKLSFN